MKRKNLKLVLNTIEAMREEGKLRPYSVLSSEYSITSEQLEVEIKLRGLENKWDRDLNAADDDGLKKTLGDLLGGSGLNFRKSGSSGSSAYEFWIPQRLPVVNDDDEIIAPGEY